jgi:argonaute-like protein implicated in RNA metabolism and viral defense
MFKARFLTLPEFRFSKDQPSNIASDTFRGLSRFGPYSEVQGRPKFGFVFAQQYKDDANNLYRALRNGVGYFRGFSNMFRVPFEKDQVFPITGFELRNYRDPHDSARAYADAILNWTRIHNVNPDLIFVLHPKTPSWQKESPYHACKAALLAEGYLSQNVTNELINNSAQFEWSVANIALAAFVKLGGVPWVIHRRSERQQFVIGLGRSELFDPTTRERERTIAFTTCMRSDGLFKFSTFAREAHSMQEYLFGLKSAVSEALEKITAEKLPVETLSLHLPKEFGRDEAEVLKEVVESYDKDGRVKIHTLKVTDDDNFFVVDNATPDGVPARGTCIKIGERDYLLYTEGREEKQKWRNRIPTALRVRNYDGDTPPTVVTDLVSQVFDLGQSNWRGFNALSRPVSILYSELIAELLGHGIAPQGKFKDTLSNKLWFL